MCGIAGHVSRSATRRSVDRMVAAMIHRGPDDQGVWERSGGGAALGNCRLSIIDLSEAGHMPMSDPSGRVRITYNGELYNYLPLRDKLARAGYPFRSQTDTEVVLAAWMTWGEAFLEQLTGMFAFAILDERDPEDPVLLLARDRLGIKPLYWTATDGGVLFASEIKVLLASGLVAPRGDRQAIWDYLSLGSIPGPRTIVEQVYSLPPGHTLTLRGGGLSIDRFWSLPQADYQGAPTMEAAAEQLRDLLETVVSEHMIADVPVGAFLSGGIDSTTLVALAAAHTREPLKTFTVKFGSGPAAVDEAENSALMARHIGSDHTEVLVSGDEISKLLPEILAAMDQPSVDGVNSWLVARAARASVTVALSGLGSDEIFAGYPHFHRLAQADRLAPRGIPPLAHTKWLQELPTRLGSGLRFLGGTPADRHVQVREVFSAGSKDRLSPDFRGETTSARTALLLDEAGGDSINATARTEVQGYLVNTLLRDADAMSMAHSLEVRVPFVDHRIVEFALSLPGDLKVGVQGGKAVLKAAVRDLLPPQIVDRPKSYFSVPLQEWAQSSLRPEIDRLLASESLFDLFDPGEVRRVSVPSSRGSGNRAWALAILGGWLDIQGVRA